MWRRIENMNETVFLVLIFLLALAPRLIFVIAARNAGLSYDESEYDMIARSLVAGKGFSAYYPFPMAFRPPTYPWFTTAFRPPGYPFLLAGIYGVAGHNLLVVRVLQAIVTAFVPVLTYLIGRRVFSKGAAQLGAFFVAIYVPFVFYTLALLTENIYIPLMLLGMWLLLKSQDHQQRGYIVMAAIAFGAAILMRPVLTFFTPLLFFWFWHARGKLKPAVINTAIVLGVVIVMVTPWSIRNYRVTNQFTYLDTNGGYNLYIGFHDGADGTFQMAPVYELIEKMKQGLMESPEIQAKDVLMHNWGKEQAREFIREHPLRAILLTPLKFAHFWNLEQRLFIVGYSWNYIGPAPAPVLALLMALIMLPFALLVLLGVVGLIYAPEKNSGYWLMLLAIAYYTAIHSIIFGEARMHYPIVPLVALFAGNGIVQLALCRRAKKGLPVKEGRMAPQSKKKTWATGALMVMFIVIWAYGFHHSWPKMSQIFAPGGHQIQLEY
ncbi:MAG: glycosyltransferase family 39 protein [Candidatus Hydrogenedentes bacterium]|nr:glycosyltransferase family 39 protein [Candidatus Hydrogenedentota bacterium]